jgi:glycosyltransferase involved in cell wall biosynthesis
MELTVIIPTRDRRATLGENLARLEAQPSEAAFAAIVVDDSSTDDTLEVRMPPAGVPSLAGRAGDERSVAA